MSRRKLRVTGFTRFLLFMLIVAPLAYFGASYYNGEDGFQKVKDLVNQGVEKVTKESESATTKNASVDASSLSECQDERKRLEKRLDRKDREIDDLQDKIEALEAKLK